MTTFDKREQAFENMFVHDEEISFKAKARRNKLLGNWAAGQLGLKGDAAVAYGNALVVASLENQSDADILHKVAEDLASTGVPEQQIAQRMEEFYRFALQQIQAGN